MGDISVESGRFAERPVTWPEAYGDPSWFLHDRFGLFLHWGLYSVAARHEWVQHNERIHPDDYRARYADQFDADRFDARSWARTARGAGMRYAVLTTKHHDGFCLWDSDLTDFKVTNTPAKRDVVGEYVEACRAEGLKVGLYHSLLDWHHPNFPVDGLHPLRDDLSARAEVRDLADYRAYLHGQVEELLTRYGRIDYLWFDFTYGGRTWGWSTGKGADDWGSEDLEALCLRLQPHLLLNDRLGLGRGVWAAEQHIPAAGPVEDGRPLVWEACHTENSAWGYDRDNLQWKTADQVVRLLVDAVSKGGNLLFNVGPTARGDMAPRSLALLRGVGAWMSQCGGAIYGAGQSPYPAPSECRLTQRGDRLFLHVFSWQTQIRLDGLPPVSFARFVHDHSELQVAPHYFAGPEPVLHLPAVPPDLAVPVVELVLAADGEPRATRPLPPPGFTAEQAEQADGLESL